MKAEIVERVLSSSKKVNVLNFPVGIEIYLLNPYRICNISPDGDWKDLGVKLRTQFNRFLAYSKINRIEKSPIGPGEELLLSNSMKQELNKIKANLEKPHAKIVWKIFWLNHLKEYDKLSRRIEDIEIKDMSDHSKAILYHFLATNDTYNLLIDPSYKINTKLWEKAFEHWAATMEDDAFWSEIEGIINLEKTKGNFELRNYTIEMVKEEVVNGIFNTLLFVPLKLIELDLTKSKDKQQRSLTTSIFLGLILKSNLGTEKTRYEYAKQLTENKISKDVTAALKEVNFKEWADTGDYRTLYDNGMYYLDQIHGVTNGLKDEAHDENIHTVTFLTEVPKIPNIHQRVIRPLLEGIDSSAIVRSVDMNREQKDKTFYTQLILGLRVLCELNIDLASKGKIIKNIEELNKRFHYARIPYKSTIEINKDKSAIKEFTNDALLNKYYLSQYCYFINGEFADPDSSIYTSKKKSTGIVTFTEYFFIPRSKLAEDYHNSKITDEKLPGQMRLFKDGDEFKVRLEALELLIPSLENQKTEWEGKLVPYKKEVEETKKKFIQDREEHGQKIDKEYERLKNDTAYLTKYRPIEIEKKKLAEKRKKIYDETEGKKKGIKKLNNAGVIVLLSGILYFIGSLTLFHFYSIVGLLVLGLAGLYMIGHAADLQEKMKKGSKESQEVKKLDDLIKEEDKKIIALEKDLKEETRRKFSEELNDLRKLEEKALAGLSKKHDAEKAELELNRITSALGNARSERDSVKSMIKVKNLVKPKSEANRHPVNNLN